MGIQQVRQDIQRFIKNVRHLILKVLRSHCVVKHKVKKGGICTKLNWRRTERIPEFLPVFAFEGNDFTASTADIGIEIERLPEMINRARTRHRTDVEEDANDRLKNGPKRIEEPAVRIDLLLVFLLQAKDDLHGNNTLLRAFDLV